MDNQGRWAAFELFQDVRFFGHYTAISVTYGNNTSAMYRMVRGTSSPSSCLWTRCLPCYSWCSDAGLVGLLERHYWPLRCCCLPGPKWARAQEVASSHSKATRKVDWALPCRSCWSEHRAPQASSSLSPLRPVSQPRPRPCCVFEASLGPSPLFQDHTSVQTGPGLLKRSTASLGDPYPSAHHEGQGQLSSNPTGAGNRVICSS